jgi:protein O-mannosyl-transferase
MTSRRFLEGPAAPLAVWLLALAAYAGTLSFGFVWDDGLILNHMRQAGEGGGLAGVLSAGYGYPGQQFGYWRPVTMLSLWLTHLAAPGSPFLFHLGNVVLHALCAAVLLLLGRRLVSARAAFLAALLFAFWPPHAESAAFVGNRHDLLACLFSLLAALAWAADREGRRPLLLAGGAAALLLAGLSKESAFVLPLALLAWGLLLPAPGPAEGGFAGWWRQSRRWLPAWGGAVALALLLRLLAAGGAAPFSTGGDVAGLWRDPALAFTVLVRYLGLLALPWPVELYYSARDLALTLPALAGAALLLAAMAGAWGKRHGRIGAAAAAWVGVCLLPVSGVLPIPGAVMAARYLTLASAGSCLLLGYWLDRALGAEDAPPPRRAPALLATGAALAALALAAGVQGSFWRDDFTVASKVIAAAPGEAVGYINLGAALGSEGHYPEAAAAFRQALAIEPSETVWLNLALAVRRSGDRLGELAVLLEAQKAFPGSGAIEGELARAR